MLEDQMSRRIDQSTSCSHFGSSSAVREQLPTDVQSIHSEVAFTPESFADPKNVHGKKGDGPVEVQEVRLRGGLPTQLSVPQSGEAIRYRHAYVPLKGLVSTTSCLSMT